MSTVKTTGSKHVTVKESDPAYINRPDINGCRFFVNGEIREWSGPVKVVESPIFLEGTDKKVDHFSCHLNVFMLKVCSAAFRSSLVDKPSCHRRSRSKPLTLQWSLGMTALGNGQLPT